LVRVDGYGVDMVGMGIGVNLPRDSSDDVILWQHAGELEMGSKTGGWKGTLTIEMV